MSETELCRLCANLAGPANSGKLFERSQRKLLRQVVDLTGLQLKNTKDLPEHICKPCEEQTLQAHRFRERCIRTQKFFAQQTNQPKPFITKQKKLKSHDREKLKKEEQSPIENVFSDIALVKVEASKVEQVEENEKKMPATLVIMPNVVGAMKEQKEDILMPTITEVLLKSEPIKSDDENSGCISDGYNPLDEEKDESALSSSSSSDEQSMAGEDNEFVPFEPQVNIVTEEKSADKGNNGKHTNKSKVPKTEKKERKKKIPKISSEKLEENFICDQCGQHFNCQKKFDYHMRRHAGDKQFQCEICPQSYFSYQSLHRHIRTHTGAKPYGCRYCDRHFMDYSSRVRHERVHTNTRPFACSICTKSFTTNYMLKDHMVTHSGERAFKCPMCSVSFSRKTHLSTHYRSMTHKQNEEKYHKFIDQTVVPIQEEYNYAEVQSVEASTLVVETTPFLTQF